MNTRLGGLMLISGVLHAAVLAAVRPPALILPTPLQIAIVAAGPEIAVPVTQIKASAAHAPAPLRPATPPATPSALVTEEPVEDVAQPHVSTPAQQASAAAAPQLPAGPAPAAEPPETVPATAYSAYAPSIKSGVTDFERVRNRVRAAFELRQTYPALARHRGWEGELAVRLRVEADGTLTQLEVDRSSGIRVLDAAALHTLRQVRSLPEAQDWLGGNHFDMVLPIRYRLTDERT